MKKRVLSVLLTLSMALTLLPVTSFASEREEPSENTVAIETVEGLPEWFSFSLDDWTPADVSAVDLTGEETWQDGKWVNGVYEAYKQQLDENSKAFYELLKEKYKTYDANEILNWVQMDTPEGMSLEVDNCTGTVENGALTLDEESVNKVKNLAYSTIIPVHAALEKDHPEMYWLYAITYHVSLTMGRPSLGQTDGTYKIPIVGIKFRIGDGTESGRINFDNGTTAEFNGAVDAFVTKVKSKNADARYDTLFEVNKLLAEQITYYSRSDNQGYDQTAHSAFIQSTYTTEEEGTSEKGYYTVCAGYTTAFKLVCDKLGIPCIYVSGQAGGGSGTWGNHAWNYVQMDDECWYAVDVTWNDGYGDTGKNEEAINRLLKTYFLVGSSKLSTDHKAQPGMNNTWLTNNNKKFGYPTLSADTYVKKTSLADAKISFGEQATYNGTEQSVKNVTVTLGTGSEAQTLTKDTDYEIASGGTATDVGETTLTIRGKGDYAGTATAKWSLQKATPTAGDFTVTGAAEEISYDGAAHAVTAKTEKSGMGTVTVKYDGAADAPKYVGEYPITLAVAEGGNYKEATLDLGEKLKIVAAAQNLQLTQNASVMVGKTLELSTLVSGAKGEVSFSLADTTLAELGADGKTLTAKGEGAVSVTVAAAEVDKNSDGKAEYSAANGTLSVSIAAKQTDTTTMKVKLDGWTYGDTPKTPGVSGVTVVDGTNVTYQYAKKNGDTVADLAGADAGDYTVKATYETADTIYTATADFAISPKAIRGAVVTLEKNELTYTGAAQTATVKSVVLNEKTLTETTDYTVSVKGETNVGTYTVTVTGAGNYADEATAQWKVEPAPLTVDQVTVEKRVYTVTAAFADADAGENKTVNYTITLKNGNYAFETGESVTGTTTGEIEKGNLAITGATVQDKAYDGTTDGTVTGVTFSGLVNGESLEKDVDYTVKAVFADGDAGTGKNVTVTVTLKDTVKNYNLSGSSGSTTANIEKVAAKVDTRPVANTLTYNYGEQELVTEGTATGGTMQYSTDNKTWSATVPKGKNAGSYEVWYKVVGDKNHKDTDAVKLDVTIAKKTVTASEANVRIDAQTYTGKPLKPKITVTDNGGTVNIPESEYTVSYSNNTEAGTATATIKNASGGNFVVNGTVTFSINQATYDGAKGVSGVAKFGTSGTVELSHYVMPGGTASITATTGGDAILDGAPELKGTKLSFAVKNDGTLVNKSATIKISVVGCKNYKEYELTVTVTVAEKYTPMVTVSPYTKTYDGKAIDLKELTFTATYGETAVPGTLQWSSLNGSGSPQNVADTKTWYVFFTPTDGDTYNLVQDIPVAVTINKAAPTGTPSYTAITTDGKKLGDAALSIGNITPAGGQVTWDAGNEQAVEANTAYAWTYTPADPSNYDVLKGNLTPWVKSTSSGGGGGSGFGGSSSSTKKNEDGSTTTTKTDEKTGTVTETTKKTDGSTIVVVTEKDGTVTKTNQTATGTTSTVVTDAAGNVTENTVTISAKDAKVKDTLPLPIESVAASDDSKNATAIKVNVPENAAVTVEIPVTTVTPGTVVVVVDNEGNETVVATTGMTKTGVTVTLEGDTTIKIVENSIDFEDVSENAYYSDAADWASARGITTGMTKTSFGPDESCTRGQLVTFLYRAAGQTETHAEKGFDDVNENSYYGDAVGWATELGIVKGYGNGLFGAEDTITREQMAVILYRFAQAAGMDTVQTGKEPQKFTDEGENSAYAQEALCWAVDKGIMQGYGDKLMPKVECTRAQIVAMLYRLLGK